MRLFIILIMILKSGLVLAIDDVELRIKYVNSGILVTLFNNGYHNSSILKKIDFCLSAPKGIKIFLKDADGIIYRHSTFLNRRCYAPKMAMSPHYGVVHFIEPRDFDVSNFGKLGGIGMNPPPEGKYELGVKICSSMRDYKLADCIYSNTLPYTVSARL